MGSPVLFSLQFMAWSYSSTAYREHLQCEARILRVSYRHRTAIV